MNLDWLAGQGLHQLPQYLVAMAIGLLIGLERERNPTAKAGVRTFALVALAGALSASLALAFDAPAILAAGLAVIGFMMIAAYYHHHEEFHDRDPGTTTIVAVIAAYLLGAMALSDHIRVAASLAVIVAILLYFKGELRGFAQALDRRELISMLQVAVAAVVVLPLLPDREFGPFAVLNARQIGLMVVLISGVSLAGYVTLRLVGPRHGAMLLGLLGGMVSSTATTMAYSRQARDASASGVLAATVIVMANLVILVRIATLVAVTAPGMLKVLAPILALALVAGGVAFAIGRRAATAAGDLAMPTIANPANMRAALGFGFLYGVVLLVAAWLVDLAGSRGIYVAALASGLADVDAITLSTSRLFGFAALPAGQAATAIVVAVASNTVVKLGIIRVVGGRELFLRCIPSLGVLLAGMGVGVALFA